MCADLHVYICVNLIVYNLYMNKWSFWHHQKRRKITGNINVKEPCSARSLAKIIGSIMSMSFVFDNICQIMTRNLHLPIVNKIAWDLPISIDSKSEEELKFWQNNLGVLPFRSIVQLYSLPERILFVDASNFAGAGVLVNKSSFTFNVYGVWM